MAEERDFMLRSVGPEDGGEKKGRSVRKNDGGDGGEVMMSGRKRGYM